MADWKERVYQSYLSAGVARAPEGGYPKDPYLDRVIRRHVPSRRGARIADLGCGHGRLLAELARHGFEHLEGVDVSLEQVEAARRLGLDRVEQGTIASFLEGRDSAFDVLFAMDVFEHLERQELFDTLDAIRTALAPDGRLIAHVPNAEGLFGMRIRYGDPTHENAFTPGSIEQILRLTGFAEVEVHEDVPVAHGLKSSVRRALWPVVTAWPRLALAVETGRTRFVLSQNMLVVASAPAPR